MNNSNTKICHLTSAHSWNDVRIFIKQCSSLAQNGFDVTLIAPNCESQTVNGIKIIGVKSIGKGRFFRMRKTTRAIFEKALEVNADVYQFHDPELLPYGNKLRKVGKKVIYDAHEDLPRQILAKHWINKYLRKFISRNAERYENKIARKLSFIFTATPFIRDRFLKINKNCIDINNFPLENELASTTNWNEKKNEVCYVGSITQIRGNAVLVEAMNSVNSSTLVLAGNFSPDSFKDELMAMPGWQNVNFVGNVSRDEVSKIMASAKAGIVTFLPMPNHVDAQPNKMFEYMSAGIPIIGSDFPLWKEIIEGNNCGICVDPLNSQEISNAINKLTQEDKLAEDLGKNGRNAVLNKYNWKIEEKKLISCYEKIINGE